MLYQQTKSVILSEHTQKSGETEHTMNRKREKTEKGDSIFPVNILVKITTQWPERKTTKQSSYTTLHCAVFA
jgi:hypothetical protein